jgi:hypothetical protein
MLACRYGDGAKEQICGMNGSRHIVNCRGPSRIESVGNQDKTGSVEPGFQHYRLRVRLGEPSDGLEAAGWVRFGASH